jgi:modulator of FtsH protease
MERQMEHVNTGTAQNVTSAETQKVLRNTYMLLSMTLAFSALTAGISMSMNLGGGTALMMSLAALAIVWFVLPRTANTAMGLPVVFLFTGLLGAALGPMLNRYLDLPNGS